MTTAAASATIRPAAAIAPSMALAVSFVSQWPYATYSLRFEVPVNSPADVGYFARIEAALEAAGWTRDVRPAPACDGILEVQFGKDGTDLFNAWRPAEKKARVNEARRILRGFGFMSIPVNHKPVGEE